MYTRIQGGRTESRACISYSSYTKLNHSEEVLKQISKVKRSVTSNLVYSQITDLGQVKETFIDTQS